jgi:hypothetical protein
VIVLQVLDEEELTFPFEGNTRFRGLEQAGNLTGEPRRLRDGYLEALQRFLAEVRRRCIGNRIGFTTVSTGDHLGAVLARFLGERREIGRKATSKRR